jgi:ribonuclease HI
VETEIKKIVGSKLLTTMKKQRSETYLNEYRKLVNYHHKSNSLVLFTDGSADNSKQNEPIKFGFLVYEKGKLLHSDSQVCRDNFNTSVKSELMAINAGLKFLRSEGATRESIVIFSDNKWVVEWAVNKTNWYSTSTDKAYYESFVMLRSLIAEFKSVNAFWVPREINQDADSLTR